MADVLIMRYLWRNNAVLCVHSLSSEPKEVRFKMNKDGEKDSSLINLLSDNHSHSEEDGRHCILLEPYGYRWYRVGGLDYLLRRSET
jgi:maltose alpha-D-glucosyltransferase/alpha-amylase